MTKEKASQEINWKQIVITSIITGLVSLAVAIVVFFYTTEKTELTYEEFPISTFQSNETELSIVNYTIKNRGQKKAENVKLYIELPPISRIKEPKIESNNPLVEFKIVKQEKNLIIYQVNSLYQFDNLNLSLLVENLKNKNDIKIEVRGNNSVGTLNDNNEKNISPVVLYITLVLVIIFIILLIVLITTARKAAKAFKFFRKRLNEESEIEDRKVADILTQGVDYCDMGMSEESMKVLIKGKYLHPESSAIHSNLARAYTRNGQMEKAIIEYNIAEKLIKGETDEMIFNYTKAHYFALNNDKESMISHLKKARDIDKERVIKKIMLDDEFDSYKNDAEFLALNE